MNKRQKEARDRLAQAKAALTEYDAKAKADAEVLAKARAKLDAYRKRATPIVVVTPNASATGTIADLSVSYGAPDTEKAIYEALLRKDDPLKINVTRDGSAVGIRTATQRVRVLDKAGARSIAKAKAALVRAQAAEQRASNAFAQAKQDAFKSAAKIEPEALAKALAKATALKRTPVRIPFDGGYERERRLREIKDAEAHMEAAKAGSVCPCSDCTHERQVAEAAEREAARVKTLPRMKATCPTHGAVMVRLDRKRRFVDYTQAEKWGIDIGKPSGPWASGIWVEDFPVGICPGGDSLILLSVYKADVAAITKAAKLRERQEQAAAKALAKAQRAGTSVDPDQLVAGDIVTVTCPHCDSVLVDAEVLAFEDYGDGDEGEPEMRAYIECAECEDSFSVADLDGEPIIRKEKAA